MVPRSAYAVVVVLLTLLLAMPSAGNTSSPHNPSSVPAHLSARFASLAAGIVPVTRLSAPFGGETAASPRPVDGAWSVIRPGWNMTPGPGVPVPAARGLPDSAVAVESVPQLPATRPTYLNLTQDLVNCCFQQNVSMPSGTWARIVLNVTGWIRPSVYDSSYEMYIDQVPILFGTTPEYGTWTVLEDLTEYTTLLRGVANVTFLLGAATLGGEFLTNISLAFYPVPSGGHAPREPTAFVPLWYRARFAPTRLAWWENATVPKDVVNATLELWAYGFGADEFWYNSAPPASPYRSLTVSVDGRPIATEFPFEFINTGGIDLFMWRPVTGVQTTADHPQRFDLTPELGMLEGARNWTLNMSGVTSGSDWIDDAVLALYTNASVTGARLVSYSASLGGPGQSSHGNLTEVLARTSYAASSSIGTASGTTNVSGSTSELFSMNSSVASHVAGGTTLGWSNVTGTARTVDVVTWSGAGGSRSERDEFNVPFEVHAGTLFVQSRSTGGGYPVFGNATTYCNDVVQVWNETHSTSVAGAPASASELYDVLLGGNGEFTGSEELTGPNAAVLLGVNQTSVVSTVPRTFEVASVQGALNGSTTHRVTATAAGPPPPNEVAAVVLDAYSGSIAVGGATGSVATDVGVGRNVSAVVLGGIAPFTFDWLSVPTGCTVANASTIPCVPAVSGNSSIALRVSDAVGDVATGNVTELQVAPDPSVRVAANFAAVDSGGTVSFTARVIGGTGPFQCVWTIAGSVTGPAQNCSNSVAWTTSGAGTVRASVGVTDAIGVLNSSPTFGLAIVAPVGAAVEVLGTPGASSWEAVTGSTVELTANISGGVGPYTIVWYNDSGPIGSGRMLNVTVGPVGTSEGVYLAINDSGGGTNQSATFVITATAAPTVNSPTSSGGFPVLLFVLFAAVGAIVVVVAVVILLRRQRAPR